MKDIQTTYKLSLKDGVYFKKDGSPFAKANGCNLQRGKMQKDGLKVTVVPVEGGFGMRILDLNKSTAKEPTEVDTTTLAVETKNPTEGGVTTTLEVKRKELLELEELETLERKIAEKKQSMSLDGGNGTASKATKGNNPSGRPKRTPFTRNRLKFPDRPGFKRHIFNDVDGGMRLAQKEAEGWKRVDDPKATVDGDSQVKNPSQMGSNVSRDVGVDNAGDRIRGVLMEIPEGWHAEAQQEKQDKITRAEAGLRQAVDAQGNPIGGGLKPSGVEDEVNRRI